MSMFNSIRTQEPTLTLLSLAVLLHEYFNKKKNLHNFAKLKKLVFLWQQNPSMKGLLKTKMQDYKTRRTVQVQIKSCSY